MHSISRMAMVRLQTIDLCIPINSGTRHVGLIELSPTGQTLLTPSAKHREAFSESHEG